MSNIRLGIIGNTTKKPVRDILPDFLDWLTDRKCNFCVSSDLASLFDVSSWDSIAPERIYQQCNMVMSFGGDGTFLQTARWIAPHEIPIIGVNLGEFGYLAEVNADGLKDCVHDLINGRYEIQDRMMLEVHAPGVSPKKTFYALNDVVIDRGGFSRIIRLETNIDGDYLNTFNADGLIISTSTGSTGYSLSTGGPILEPCIEGMIINPISPHMLANRPLVISDKRVVEVITFSHADVYHVSVDGQRVLKPRSGETIVVKRAPFTTKIVIFSGFNFNSLLRNKLQWRNQIEKHFENHQ